jgi:hypothetical protein
MPNGAKAEETRGCGAEEGAAKETIQAGTIIMEQAQGDLDWVHIEDDGP